MRYAGQTFQLPGGAKGTFIKQVSKATARKAFINGEVVWLHPCNMGVNNPWQSPAGISYELHKNSPYYNGDSAEKVFNDDVEVFKNMCCVKELGRYPIFFIKTTPCTRMSTDMD